MLAEKLRELGVGFEREDGVVSRAGKGKDAHSIPMVVQSELHVKSSVMWVDLSSNSPIVALGSLKFCLIGRFKDPLDVFPSLEERGIGN